LKEIYKPPRRSRAGGNPSLVKLLMAQRTWIPACAGTIKFNDVEKFKEVKTLELAGIIKHFCFKVPAQQRVCHLII
jgi:hypothetical protein